MTKIISGSKRAAEIRAKIKEEIDALKAKAKRIPKLVVIKVGNDPASAVYVRNKERACEKAGMLSKLYALSEETSEAELVQLIKELNADKTVDGILCQLPLPRQINEENILNSIDPAKDVDGFSPYNAGCLLSGKKAHRACTPLGIIDLLKSLDEDLSGKHAVVIGRSNIVGKPVSLLLLEQNLTVTMTHSRTKNLAELAAKADVLVVAIGRANFVDESFINPEQIIIDVGINRTEDGLVGDVNFPAVSEKVKAITPVPGGVGPMTIAMLLANTMDAYQSREEESLA